MTSSTVPVSQALPDLAALRAPVQRGDTRAEGWRRRQLQAVATLVEEHEDEILAALHQDLGKPELEGMVEILALRQELKLCRRQLRRWMAPRRR